MPLTAFFLVGSIWTTVGLIRHRPLGRFGPELLVGAFVAWLALTETYVHDPRYAVPMMVYLAVLGVGWIARLPSRPRAVTAAVLMLVALANSLGVGFGVGRAVVAGSATAINQRPGAYTYFVTNGLWLGAPIRKGNMLGLLRALHRDGVRKIRWYSSQESDIEFSFPGIAALAQVAGLSIAGASVDPSTASRHYAFLLHGTPAPGAPRPCTRLQSGAGVWVRLGGSRGNAGWEFCPLRHA